MRTYTRHPPLEVLGQSLMRWLLFSFLTLLLISPPTYSGRYTKLQVQILGLPQSLSTLVEVSLSIKQAEKEKKINAERIESLHQLAPSEITTTLEALGYYHSQIEVSLTPMQDGFLASYQIDVGRPTFINSVVVKITGEGRGQPELKALVQNPPIRRGMQLTHHEYERYKQAILSKALQLGYLDTVFHENEIQINRNQYSANIILVLETGKQYYFGEVNFQKTAYPDHYLERYIPFAYGSPYTTTEILAFQKRLMDTDLFRHVRIMPLPDETKNNIIPLNVRLKAKPKNKYSGSVGYGTDSGYRSTLWYEHRRQDLPGHRINAEVRGAKWNNYGNLRYTIPGENPTTDRTVFAFRVIEEKFRDGKYSLRQDISATQIKRIERWERLLGLHYLINERYKEIPIEPKRNAHFVIPNFGFSFSTVQKKCPIQEGFRLSFSGRGALKPLFSTTSFAQTDIRAKWILSFGLESRVLLRTEIGATATPNFKKIPLSLRYFTGGDQTVRGYGYKSLGPRRFYYVDGQQQEVVIGGQYLACGSIEFERKVWKQFSGAVFFDIGQSMNKLRTSFARSVGVGIRYATPLGPLRIDVAQPLKVYTQRKARPRLHLTFGMDL